MASSKVKRLYVCSECGISLPRWQGQCSGCQAWNTITETQAPVLGAAKTGFSGQTSSEIQYLSDIDLTDIPRFSTGLLELDRVLGGGVVPGSVNLIGGQPGAGKSTLLLQVSCYLAQQNSVIYVTGEESLQQVALRGARLGLANDQLKMLSETSVEVICELAIQHKPMLMVIDSIQVMHLSQIQSAPGSVAQVRESAAFLTRFAKQHQIAIILVGHVTKDGTLAGPKVLEHCVDCSTLLEVSSDSRFRTLRCHKNRFGAVNELGVFAMTGQGMREVSNPSAIFLNQSRAQSAGTVVMVVWEGTRPMLVELQALADSSALSNPRRVCVGMEFNRLSMLLAVLNRHGNLQLADQDIFVNVVGGIKIDETSADLALLAALISSYRNHALSSELIVFGEVGLSGEIRPVPYGQERLKEATKHGFTRAIIPQGNAPKKAIEGLDISAVATLNQAIDLL